MARLGGEVKTRQDEKAKLPSGCVDADPTDGGGLWHQTGDGLSGHSDASPPIQSRDGTSTVASFKSATNTESKKYL